ncbi:MAG: hypothetical protein LBE34_13955 [Flavobacteriaceae bacterium]|jgi:hypothetical protein|nr:hypothetical protein [Flavobacteriaceae bacterium]
MNQLSEMREYLLANVEQIKFSVKIGSVAGGGAVVMSLANWWNANFDYVTIAMGLIAADHALGSVVHKWWVKDFDIKKNGIGLLVKLTMVMLGGAVFEGLTHITKEQDFVYTYLKMTTRLIVCIYPGLSALENMSIISGGVFPPKALIDVFKGFQKDLSPKKIVEEKNTNDKKEE